MDCDRDGRSSFPAITRSEGDPIDPPTGLPLIVCPHCHDIRIVAYTCLWTKNAGKRFFKCPCQREKDPTSCPSYWFQDQYEDMLRRSGRLRATNIDNGASCSSPAPVIGMLGHQEDGNRARQAEEGNIELVSVKEVDAVKERINRFNRMDVFVRWFFVFLAGLTFLVAACILLLAVIIYMVVVN